MEPYSFMISVELVSLLKSFVNAILDVGICYKSFLVDVKTCLLASYFYMQGVAMAMKI